MIASGPNKIPVRMTDEYLRYQEAQSAYIVTFFYDESQVLLFISCSRYENGWDNQMLLTYFDLKKHKSN